MALYAVDAPAVGGFSITPADSDLTRPIRGIYVGGAGNLRVTTLDGSDLTFDVVPVGLLMPIQIKRVWSTSTTATLLIGLY